MKKLLLLFAVLATAINSSARTFTVNGIFYSVISEDDMTCEVRGCQNSGDIVIPSTVNHFEDTYIVIKIGSNAFQRNSLLTSVVIPNTVTEIGSDAFQRCENLKSVVMGNSVTEIGRTAFERCTNLTSINIPNSVTEIGIGVFKRCASLESFTGKYASNDNRCLIKDGVLISFAPAGLTNYSIPESVSEIGTDAFYDCQNIEKVVIPNSVTKIGYESFRYCYSLISVVIPNSVIEIDGFAFYNCYGLTSVEIGNSVTTIGEYAFNGCSSLTSVEIPNTVTTIGARAFIRCSSLERISGKYASNDNRCLIIDGVLNAFAPAGITNYSIPESVNKIGDSVFDGNQTLTSVVIPNTVNEIGVYAFCTGENLKDITSLAVTPPSIINNTTFDYGLTLNGTLKVPAESLEAYKAADYWKEFQNIVGIDVAAIDCVTSDEKAADSKPYNLQGQPVSEDYKGIVIQNGRKVLRK